jgi:hypothetical protein
VHDLFVISGRSDALGCSIAQPDFAGELSRGNLAFRIPTPVFGAGLVENTPDQKPDQRCRSTRRSTLGIGSAPLYLHPDGRNDRRQHHEPGERVRDAARFVTRPSCHQGNTTCCCAISKAPSWPPM